MNIDAAKAEGTYGRPAGMAVAQPGPRFGIDIDRRVAYVKLGVGLFHIDGGRQYFMVQGQYCFYHSCRARRRFGVADLRFDGTESNVSFFRIVFAKDHIHGGELRGVAGAGARSVGFDQADGRCRVAGVFIGAVHRQRLSGGTRCVDRLEAAVARSADAFNDGINLVAIPFGVCQPFQHQHTQSFADEHAVGFIAERADVSGFGKSRSLAERHIHERRVVRIYSTGKHHITAPFHQLAQRHLNGAQ